MNQKKNITYIYMDKLDLLFILICIFYFFGWYKLIKIIYIFKV